MSCHFQLTVIFKPKRTSIEKSILNQAIININISLINMNIIMTSHYIYIEC